MKAPPTGAPLRTARLLPVRLRPGTGSLVMAMTIIVLGFYLIYPIVLILILTFNEARIFVEEPRWGFGNWTGAWDNRLLFESLWNSFLLWFLVAATSFPIAISIALILARTKVPFSNGLEYLFWVAFMFPSISSTIGWIMLGDPDVGFLNIAIETLPFVDQGPFNIYSLPGIVWAKLMADGIAFKVMLITPAFRNMDGALEEAARVSGAGKIGSMLRVTLPVMVSPMALVLALQLIRVFQGFETEQLLGPPFGFYVFSTLIYRLVSGERFEFGQAVVLASVTFLVIFTIIPLQRWILTRRRYTTVTGNFKPGLIDLGKWNSINLGIILMVIFVLTGMPFLVLIIGSFMNFAGFFEAEPTWSQRHWETVLTDTAILKALRTTLILSITAGIVSPLLFSILGYMLVRTRWRGRIVLDSTIWGSAAIPGILSGLGLLLMFLTTPGLSWLYGSLWALILVVIISGNTTGVNIFKGVLVQIGSDLEEAARVSGAGWVRTYTRVVLPLLMPTMILIGILNFVSAAGATSSVILLASRDTRTLAIIALEMADADIGQREAAGAVSLLIMVMTLGVALAARTFGLRLGVRHNM